MYCWKCGMQNPEEATFCNRCGSKLREVPVVPAMNETNRPAASAPESHSQVAAPVIESPSEAVKPGLATGASIGPTGVGGWLSLFCFGLTVLAPLAAIGYFLDSTVNHPDFTVVVLSAVLFFGLAVYSFITGIRIWMLKPNAIRQAKIYLIVGLALSIVSVATYAATTETSDAAIVTGASTFSGGVINFAIWWIYLAKSKRVRNTFKHTSLRGRAR